MRACRRRAARGPAAGAVRQRSAPSPQRIASGFVRLAIEPERDRHLGRVALTTRVQAEFALREADLVRLAALVATSMRRRRPPFPPARRGDHAREPSSAIRCPLVRIGRSGPPSRVRVRAAQVAEAVGLDASRSPSRVFAVEAQLAHAVDRPVAADTRIQTSSVPPAGAGASVLHAPVRIALAARRREARARGPRCRPGSTTAPARTRSRSRAPAPSRRARGAGGGAARSGAERGSSDRSRRVRRPGWPAERAQERIVGHAVRSFRRGFGRRRAACRGRGRRGPRTSPRGSRPRGRPGRSPAAPRRRAPALPSRSRSAGANAARQRRLEALDQRRHRALVAAG